MIIFGNPCTTLLFSSLMLVLDLIYGVPLYVPQISSYFTDKLLGIVHDTILHMKELNKSEDGHHRSPGLPQLAGDIHKGDAALEFIKHVCGVFSLDQNVHHDVMVFTCPSESYATHTH